MNAINKTIWTAIVIMIAVATIGCIDEPNVSIEREQINIPNQHLIVDEPIIPISEPEPKLTPIEIVIKAYLSDREYVINAKNGSEIYVCSHFGCDMAQALIDDGYDAGVVCDHTNKHILTWINLNGVRYVIEPQTGEYWISDNYNPKHNVDYVSLSKGKEFAKSSSEVLHR